MLKIYFLVHSFNQRNKILEKHPKISSNFINQVFPLPFIMKPDQEFRSIYFEFAITIMDPMIRLVG